MRNANLLLIVSSAALSSCNAFSTPSKKPQSITLASSSTRLHMSGFPHKEEDFATLNNSNNNNKKKSKKKKRRAELSAVAIATTTEFEGTQQEFWADENFVRDSIIPVLSSSCLITANTVGASCLVLPELASGPGFGMFSGIALLTYVVNLVSGLIMAETAIQQYEASGSEGSSSFKDFADASFDSPIVSNGIGWVSILTNALVLAFTFGKAGEVGSELLGIDVDPTVVAMGFVALVGVVMSTMTRENLSNAASVCVAGLFVSFAGLLLPALAAVPDPMATLTAPGVSDLPLASAAQAFPILLLSLVYQNIVPSVAKILNYDRVKTTASLALGSFIPLAMYLAWCFVGLGGGMEAGGAASGALLTAFSMATIAGSSIGTTMSVAEEFDSFFSTNDSNDDSDNKDESNADVFSIPAVAASIAIPMVAITAFGGDDLTGALGLAGSIGTPLLYGLVPAVMAFKTRQETTAQQQSPTALVPGGMVSLAALGLASTGMVGQSLLDQVTTTFAI